MSQPRVFINPVVTLAGVDITASCTKATVGLSYSTVDVTPLGAPTQETAQGTGQEQISLDLLADDAGDLDGLFWPLVKSGAPFAVAVQPQAGTASASNPIYSMVGWLLSYNPMDSGVGGLTSVSVTIPCADPSGVSRSPSGELVGGPFILDPDGGSFSSPGAGDIDGGSL